MPTTCEINFENNPLRVLYTGQWLRGSVDLNLTEAKTVRGIYINIHGSAHSHWSQGSGKSRKSYTGHEQYLDERTNFVGGSTGREQNDYILFFFLFILMFSISNSELVLI